MNVTPNPLSGTRCAALRDSSHGAAGWLSLRVTEAYLPSFSENIFVCCRGLGRVLHHRCSGSVGWGGSTHRGSCESEAFPLASNCIKIDAAMWFCAVRLSTSSVGGDHTSHPLITATLSAQWLRIILSKLEFCSCPVCDWVSVWLWSLLQLENSVTGSFDQGISHQHVARFFFHCGCTSFYSEKQTKSANCYGWEMWNNFIKYSHIFGDMSRMFSLLNVQVFVWQSF